MTVGKVCMFSNWKINIPYMNVCMYSSLHLLNKKISLKIYTLWVCRRFDAETHAVVVVAGAFDNINKRNRYSTGGSCLQLEVCAAYLTVLCHWIKFPSASRGATHTPSNSMATWRETKTSSFSQVVLIFSPSRCMQVLILGTGLAYSSRLRTCSSEYYTIYCCSYLTDLLLSSLIVFFFFFVTVSAFCCCCVIANIVTLPFYWHFLVYVVLGVTVAVVMISKDFYCSAQSGIISVLLHLHEDCNVLFVYFCCFANLSTAGIGNKSGFG